jgi:hypothetical protein
VFGSWESDADGARFFLSRRGRTDLSAELGATIRGFFAPAAAGDDHPLCRFPARFAWLNARLGIDLARIPQRTCPKLERFVTSLGARSATVVFSSYYLGNAASAFGHTLLRINKQATGAGAERRQLLDTGVNYSAEVDTGNAVLYALKGMTGMFRGTFQRMPYYYKVREYNDYESRDLWEYELALDDAELTMLVLHLWEVAGTYFDYFYMSENCSFHILSALEVARPTMELVDRVKWPVIPADTIKALVAEPGLVSGVAFRPSLRSQFRARVRGMSRAELELVEALANHAVAAAPPDMPAARVARSLDAAIDLVDIRHGEEILTRPGSVPARRRQSLLARRAGMAIESPEIAVIVPDAKAPHRGHGSRQLRYSSGMASGIRPFAAIGGRLALHSLADPADGYPETSQLEFLPFEVRGWFDDGTIELDRVSLVTVANLAPIDRFDQKISWHLDTGMRRARDEGCSGCPTGFFDLGGGFTVATAGQGLAAFGMTESTVAYHPDIDGLAGPVRVGLGGSLGARARAGDVVCLVRADLLWMPRQAPDHLWSATGSLRWMYAGAAALGVEARAEAARSEAQLSLYYYY